MTNTIGQREKQPFENYPRLAGWIEKLANRRIEGFSHASWCSFLGEINTALSSPSADEGEPEPYIVGNCYRTQAGEMVRFVSVHNHGTNYETMEDEDGIHRYTRRDFGRVTGTAHDYSDPRNTPPLYAHPPSPGVEKTGEREAVALEEFPPGTEDVQSKFVLVHQLRASADIQDWATKRETGWATTSDRADLMRRAAVALEVLALSPTSGGGTGPRCACGGVPLGWKLVPVEPTDEMLAAADSAIPRFETEDDGIRVMGADGARDAYAAMLSAAPSSPEDIGGLE